MVQVIWAAVVAQQQLGKLMGEWPKKALNFLWDGLLEPFGQRQGFEKDIRREPYLRGEQPTSGAAESKNLGSS